MEAEVEGEARWPTRSVLSPEDLRTNKLAAGYAKDLLDVELLAQLPKTKKRR